MDDVSKAEHGETRLHVVRVSNLFLILLGFFSIAAILLDGSAASTAGALVIVGGALMVAIGTCVLLLCIVQQRRFGASIFAPKTLDYGEELRKLLRVRCRICGSFEPEDAECCSACGSRMF